MPHLTVPRYVKWADELPTTHMGKIHKHVIREAGMTPSDAGQRTLRLQGQAPLDDAARLSLGWDVMPLGGTMDEYVQVLTTTATREDAQDIASTLVEKRLAGCVQIIGPIVSTFWWQGKVERSEEWLCLIKSEKRLYAELEQSITAQHRYETPEIIALPVVAGSRPYLQWLSHELHGP